jgi:DHA1 family multidrug resistance protein-like MFS transporter
MVAVQFIMSLSVTVTAPILPLFLPQIGVLGADAIELWGGVLSSVNFLVSGLLAPVWGAVADRRGRKLMVLRASAGVSLVSALMALVTGPWQLFGLTLLMGAAGGFSSAAVTLVASQVPERRLGYALGWLSTAQMVGGLMGPVVAGLIADLAGSYRAVFLYTSLLAGVALVVCWRLVQEPPNPAAGRRSGSLRRRLGLLAGTAGLPALLGVMLMTQLGTRSVVPVVTLFVVDLSGSGPALATLAGLAMSVTGLGDVLASPFLGRRSDSLGYRRVLLICLLGAALCTAPMAFAQNYWVFVAERFGVGFFIGGILPTANALIGRSVTAGERGLVFGFTATASLFGAFAGPLIGGGIAAWLGMRAVFVVTALLFVAILVWVYAVVRDPPASPAGSS